jgi:hypothetical protein
MDKPEEGPIEKAEFISRGIDYTVLIRRIPAVMDTDGRVAIPERAVWARFHDFKFSTTDQEDLKALRKSPSYGKEFFEQTAGSKEVMERLKAIKVGKEEFKCTYQDCNHESPSKFGLLSHTTKHPKEWREQFWKEWEERHGK